HPHQSSDSRIAFLPVPGGRTLSSVSASDRMPLSRKRKAGQVPSELQVAKTIVAVASFTLFLTSMRRRMLAQFIESGLKGIREFIRGTTTPVVQEDHQGLLFGHVLMNRYYIDAIFPQCFQDGSQLAFKHGYVACNYGIFLCAIEGSPRVQAHASVDRGAVVL